MKKILCAILCLCMVFSLCACGDTEPSGGGESTPLPASDGTDASGAPAEAIDAHGAPLGERVIIRTEKTQESFNAPDGSVILLFSYVTPTVLIDGSPEVASAINEQLNLLDEAYITGSDEEPGKNHILEDALDNYSYVYEKDAELNTVFTAARTVSNTRADGSVISFLFFTSIYTGGSSGSHAYKAVNYSSETGGKLTLDDLSADPAAFRQALADSVVSAAQANSMLYGQISQHVEDADAAIAAIVREGSWYFSSEGIVFFPAFGELKAEDQGLPTFTVPYSEFAELIDARFLPVKRDGAGSFDVVRVSDVQDGTVQNIDRLLVADGDELYLRIEGTAYDVTISSFFYVHQAEGDERFHAKDRLWYASYMTDCALQICTLVPNGMPDLMITYTDSDYLEHRLFISQSGEGDGVALVDDTIEAVG